MAVTLRGELVSLSATLWWRGVDKPPSMSLMCALRSVMDAGTEQLAQLEQLEQLAPLAGAWPRRDGGSQGVPVPWTQR
jgi:hypothetical protein